MQWDHCELSLPSFLARPGSFQQVASCPCSAVLHPAPCPRQAAPQGRTDFSPSGWRAPSCQRLLCIACTHHRKIFHCKCPGLRAGSGSSWPWATSRFPQPTAMPIYYSADQFPPWLTTQPTDAPGRLKSTELRLTGEHCSLLSRSGTRHKNTTQKPPAISTRSRLTANIRSLPIQGCSSSLSCLW